MSRLDDWSINSEDLTIFKKYFTVKRRLIRKGDPITCTTNPILQKNIKNFEICSVQLLI